MGRYYYLEVYAFCSVLRFKVSTGDVEEDPTVIEYKVENDNAAIFLDASMTFVIGKYYPCEHEYEPVFKKLQEIFPGLDLTEFRNMILKEYPIIDDD